MRVFDPIAVAVPMASVDGPGVQVVPVSVRRFWDGPKGSWSVRREHWPLLREDPCAYCGALGEGTVDHITPRCVGGDSAWLNVAGACRECNRWKAGMSLLEFLLVCDARDELRARGES